MLWLDIHLCERIHSPVSHWGSMSFASVENVTYNTAFVVLLLYIAVSSSSISLISLLVCALLPLIYANGTCERTRSDRNHGIQNVGW
jgi:hypothetical protein